MTLHYENSRLVAFLLTLIEETSNEIMKWTKHTVISDLPAEIQSKLNMFKKPLCWFDSKHNNTTFYLVGEYDDAMDMNEYSLYGIERGGNVTAIESAVVYAGSMDPICVLTLEVTATAELDRNEAVSEFLDEYEKVSPGSLGRMLK